MLDLPRSLREHARDIDRDVAHADHRDTATVCEKPGESVRLSVGMPGVPVDEVGRGNAPRQILTRDTEGAIARSAVREHDRVVALAQLGKGQIAPHFHIADEAHTRMVEDLVERVAHGPDAQVVGCDAVTHEPEGAGQLIDDVDGDRDVLLAHKSVRGIHPRRARADDGDAQGSGHVSSSAQA